VPPQRRELVEELPRVHLQPPAAFCVAARREKLPPEVHRAGCGVLPLHQQHAVREQRPHERRGVGVTS
jgi:hypothetical protein